MTPEILRGFYLARVRKQIKEIENRGRTVVLVGHSAGGWLVRRIVGEEDSVLGMVSLGVLHFPARVNDATRGALQNYDTELPGAYFKDRFYVSVRRDGSQCKRWTLRRATLFSLHLTLI